jgi:uncharacterized protein (DUF488 family)
MAYQHQQQLLAPLVAAAAAAGAAAVCGEAEVMMCVRGMSLENPVPRGERPQTQTQTRRYNRNPS